MEVNCIITSKTAASYSSRKMEETIVERSVCVCVRERWGKREMERGGKGKE